MTLAELIQRQKEKARTAQNPLDWRVRKEKWLAELEKLLTAIETWLLAAGVRTDEMQRFSQEINEETLGRYTANGLRVRIGAAVVTFRPIGSVLIGAYGRIDVTSDLPSTPRVKLIADVIDVGNPYEQDWHWLVYPGRMAGAPFSLDEEELAHILAVVLGEEILIGC